MEQNNILVRPVVLGLLGTLLLLISFAAAAIDTYAQTERGSVIVNSYGECWQSAGGQSGNCSANDTDGDGVNDHKDKCPDTPRGAPVDADGCTLDSDGDGATDDKDQCPDTPRGVDVYVDGCPLDTDMDGVPDYLDKCPDTERGLSVNAEGCHLDADGDGVTDEMDKCPDTPRGAEVDSNGCMEKLVLNNVEFETDSSQLTATAQGELDLVAEALRIRTNIRYLTVVGHTDSQGSAAYNQRLSEKRAQGVADYLTANGVKTAITASGKGEADPVADNASAEGRARNRRVELKVEN